MIARGSWAGACGSLQSCEGSLSVSQPPQTLYLPINPFYLSLARLRTEDPTDSVALDCYRSKGPSICVCVDSFGRRRR